jgi:uncharacterized OsmC-like protein
MENISIVRQSLEKVSGVSRSWFEFDADFKTKSFTKTLVVEVDVDTDPSSYSRIKNVLEEIICMVSDTLTNQTTMIVHNLRVVPKSRSKAD